jgi:hypothetical protein
VLVWLRQSDDALVKRLVTRLYGDAASDRAFGYEIALVTTAVTNVLASYWKHCDALVAIALEMHQVGTALCRMYTIASLSRQ